MVKLQNVYAVDSTLLSGSERLVQVGLVMVIVIEMVTVMMMVMEWCWI